MPYTTVRVSAPCLEGDDEDEAIDVSSTSAECTVSVATRYERSVATRSARPLSCPSPASFDIAQGAGSCHMYGVTYASHGLLLRYHR